MKTPMLPLGRLFATACLCLLPAGTGRAAEPAYEFLSPDDPAIAEIRRLGERVVDHAGGALLSEVRRTLTTDTPALAVAKLHLKDYKLPPGAPGKPVVTAIRRTSLRVRSEANAPDEADLAALRKIQHQLEEGESISKLLVQKVAYPGQAAEWRVYRPLATPGQCLVCHGSKEELGAGVADNLKTFFPADQAVDYTPGSWRGLLRVSIAEAGPAK